MYQAEDTIFDDLPQLIYATFGQRLVAFLIDGIILSVVNTILRQQITSGIYSYSEVSLISLLLYWLYAALMESSARQATLGKMAMNIKVVDTSGNRISFGKATGRYFGQIISSLIFLIGYFMMLWDAKNQTLHDKLAGTLVVKS